MKTNCIKTTLAIASLALAVTSSHAATVLNLTVDGTNTTTGGFGTNSANTVTDGFAYNPDSPASPLPDQGSFTGVAAGWHGDLATGNHVLSLTVAGGPLTTNEANSTIYFDLYGRNSNIDRDNNYTVTLYNGDYSTQVAQLTGQSVADAAPHHNRSTFTLASGVTFDRIQVTSPAGVGNPAQYFTVMEVRAATVPEPSAAILSGLGVLALLRRRRLS